MPDLATRITTRHSGLLRVDEQVLGAWLALPVGHLPQPMAYAAHGPVVGAALARVATLRTRTTVGGLAARLGRNGPSIIVDTDQRWLALDRHRVTGAPTELIAQWAPAEVSSVRVDRSRVTSHLHLSFTDSTQILFEAVRGHAFAAAAAPA